MLKLPALFPAVLYSGNITWQPALNVHELVDMRIPDLLKSYQPNFRFWFLDSKKFKVDDNSNPHSQVLPLIKLEQASDDNELEQIAQQLITLLANPHDASLRRAWTRRIALLLHQV